MYKAIGILIVIGNIPVIMLQSIAAELIPSSPQIRSEHPDFCFDASHELKLRFALGDSYHHMGKYEDAKEVLEEAWRVCIKENMRETNESAWVAGLLGWIYQ